MINCHGKGDGMVNISVVIPTYNRERYIKKAVESVLVQEGDGDLFSVIEIIIADDGSSDDTESVVSLIKDDRIIYHRSSTNRGAGAARNAGVRIAKGEWVAFQDSDDVWHYDKLRKQTEYLLSDPGVGMVSHRIRALIEGGKEIITPVPEGSDRVATLAGNNYIGTPTMLVRKYCFDELSGFDEGLSALEDWDFALRFADRYKIGMVDEPLIDVDMVLEGISADASKYYESRCKMTAFNRDILMRHGCFNDAVEGLLIHARENGVLESVGKMLELYLQ